ncbi:MAG: diaminopimelate epimerase [Lachnospiraceae bacterium]|nr:diaminopimelate epimerase [Lachnospiraceae bacterium]
MRFRKMQGCGNDYIYVDTFTQEIPASVRSELAVRLSDRHFGIGSDGLIFINPSEIADFEMEMYNADGSRSEMCGNGIRCVARYVYDHKMTDQKSFTIESFKKVKQIRIVSDMADDFLVRVDMGEPQLTSSLIPVVSDKETVVDEEIVSGGVAYRMTCVSMGNPHAVLFEDPDRIDLPGVGRALEHHAAFPNRTNVEFVKIKDKEHVRMRVWERGTGETLACGTGCCATAVACILNGYTGRRVFVEVLGGEIEVEWKEEDGHVYMTGPAVNVFDGEVSI